MALPRIIGLAGPSCSGKTTIAQQLACALPGRNTLLSLDSYYRDFAHLSPAEKDAFNFDSPDALDRPLLERQLAELAEGMRVDIPVYDFATHSRISRTESREPGDHLIVEGLFTLYWESIRRLFTLSIFVRADDDLCLERRLQRDTSERGRTRASILAQYESQIRPMYHCHVHPTIAHADLVIDGAAPLADSIDRILACLS